MGLKEDLVSVWIELIVAFSVSRFASFFFFFFFLCVNSNLTWVHCARNKNHYSCTAYHCSRIKKILKIDPTVLLIYLKIILLQYFQFLIFSFQFQQQYAQSKRTLSDCLDSDEFYGTFSLSRFLLLLFFFPCA